jgi:NADH dehydrogenase [ubiquinone] 1 alpha subcomplex assembly factor 2
MKQLAAEADARWEAKPRVMEDVGKPGTAKLGQPEPPLKTGGDVAAQKTAEKSKASSPVAEQSKPDTKAAQDAKDPWAKAKAQGPGENWQPTAWTPPAKK